MMLYQFLSRKGQSHFDHVVVSLMSKYTGISGYINNLGISVFELGLVPSTVSFSAIYGFLRKMRRIRRQKLSKAGYIMDTTTRRVRQVSRKIAEKKFIVHKANAAILRTMDLI